MELDFRCPSADINTVYLSSFLGKGDVAGHRCDCSCQVQHVWANLYRCTTSGSSHVCDQNCNQRIIYDNHSTLCRVSGRVFPLTASEQEAIRGVRRKRDAESSDSSPLKRCRDMLKSAASFEAPFRQRALPVPTFMDIN